MPVRPVLSPRPLLHGKSTFRKVTHRLISKQGPRQPYSTQPKDSNRLYRKFNSTRLDELPSPRQGTPGRANTSTSWQSKSRDRSVSPTDGDETDIFEEASQSDRFVGQRGHTRSTGVDSRVHWPNVKDAAGKGRDSSTIETNATYSTGGLPFIRYRGYHKPVGQTWRLVLSTSGGTEDSQPGRMIGESARGSDSEMVARSRENPIEDATATTALPAWSKILDVTKDSRPTTKPTLVREDNISRPKLVPLSSQSELRMTESSFGRILKRLEMSESNAGSMERSKLAVEISIGTALESYHADDSSTQPQNPISWSPDPRQEPPMGRTARSVAQKSVLAPKLSSFTKRSAPFFQRNKSNVQTRRARRRLEDLNRADKQPASTKVTTLLQKNVPKAAEATSDKFIQDSQQKNESTIVKSPLGSTKLDTLPSQERPTVPQIGRDSPTQSSFLSKLEKPGPIPPQGPTLQARTRDDLRHINREEIPFEDSWFDDIKEEQPPELRQQSAEVSQQKLDGESKDETLVTFRVTKPAKDPSQTIISADIPSNDQVLLSAVLDQNGFPTKDPRTDEKPDHLPSAEQIVHNTLTAPPVYGETPAEAVLKAVQKLSLREELFPEESRYTKLEQAFITEKHANRGGELPHMPFDLDSPTQADKATTGDASFAFTGSSRSDQVAVLLLETASTALSDDDFQRLAVKGKHIGEWRSAGGSVQVIPARDPDTLFPRAFYFLVFASDSLARAYRDHAQNLHRIARTYTPNSIESPMAPPPGMLINGQNIHRLMQDFTLCPPGQEFHLRLVDKPYSAPIVKAIEDRSHPRRSGRSVLFWLKWYPSTTTAIIEFLTQDGRIRGLPWGPMDGKGSVEKLKDENAPDGRGPWTMDEENEGQEGESEVDGERGELDDSEQGVASGKKEATRYPRWIISFENEDEARRFVRTWHQRPWPGNVGRDDVTYRHGDSSPLIQAEYLW